MPGWKTLLFNGGIGAAVLAGQLLSYFEAVDWSVLLPPDIAPYAVLGIGIANIVLRHVTGGPAGWRQPRPFR
jgi:hypothetical protein